MREVELGLLTEPPSGETAQALERALGEPLNERERLSIRGARYVDFRLIPNFDRHHRKWRHDGRHDVRFILRVTTDGDSIMSVSSCVAFRQ